MRIIDDLEKVERPLANPVLTIGNFDGVHKGHLVLFNKVKERAKVIQGISAVMTFEPHPIKVMKPGNGPPLITQTPQKLRLISQTGIDYIFCLPFTKKFASISAEGFIHDVLFRKIGVKEIVVGYDYTFGNNREGGIPLLHEAGKELGFRVHVMDPVYVSNQLVSSTAVRDLVREGDLHAAETFLGRMYQICGTVVKGENRGGRLLGYPTANLQFSDELIPKRGIYAVTVEVDNKVYNGVTNIGHNPTFGDNALSIETHILDFSQNIVGKMIKINFLKRLRDEKPFDSIQSLADQIAEDIQEAKKIF